jgi:hypothetical protein
MKQSMSPTRFRSLAEAFGGAIERWPAAERKAARELLLREPSLRSVLGAEAELDALFAAGETNQVPDALLQRLQSIPEGSPKKQPFPVKPRSFWPAAVGWAVAASVGLWLGTNIEEPEPATAAVQAEQAEEDEQMAVMEIAAGDILAFEEAP